MSCKPLASRLLASNAVLSLTTALQLAMHDYWSFGSEEDEDDDDKDE